MADRYDEYRTGQGVPVGGQYQCQAGQKVSFKEGEEFPLCPATGEETTWTHEDR